MRIRSCLVLPAVAASLAWLPSARADQATFTQLLARAQAEEAAGHHWAPAGDNLAETFVAMINIMSTATPDELAAFDKLLHEEQGTLAATGAGAAADRGSAAAGDQVGQSAAGSAPGDASSTAAPAGPASAPDASRHGMPANGGSADHDPAPSEGAAPAAGSLNPRPAAPAAAAAIDAPTSPTSPITPAQPEPMQSDGRSAADVPGAAAALLQAVTANKVRLEAEPAVPAAAGTEAGLAKPQPGATTATTLDQVPATAAPHAAPAPTARAASSTRAATTAERSIAGPQPLETASPGRVADTFGRGAAAEARGDISAARRFYTSAAQNGSAGAARALARLYDPAYLRNKTIGGIDGDADVARQWNERAAALDNSQADLPMQTLSAR